MIKAEVIENFTLKNFDELKNIVRKSAGKEGELKVGDTFECSEEMAKYLTGNNKLNKTVVKIIEVEPKKAIIEVDSMAKELFKEELPKKKKKKSSKK